MGFGLKTAISVGLALFGSSGGFGGQQQTAQQGSSLIPGFMQRGAKALLASQGIGQDGSSAQPFSRSGEIRQPRSVAELTRGDPGTRAMRLDPVQQRLYNNAVVRQRAQALASGSRDRNLNSLLRDNGLVSPTTRQGRKTAALETPSLKEIDV
tara:strand:+ start:854 stop:1312 length:459 start_codon:yes stop_codon:yes gene_type:complete